MYSFTRFPYFQRWCCGLLVVISLLSVAACESTRTPDKGYFAIDSLMDAQIRSLLKHNASVHKQTLLGEKEVPIDITPPDEQRWRDELDVFRDLNIINRHYGSNLYVVENHVQDEHSNLRIRSATLREGVDESAEGGLRVRYLKIFYEGSYQNIRRLEARYAESNSMYDNDRFLTMVFNDVYQAPLLTEYSIEGGQKIVLGDSVNYRVRAQVLYTQD
jgi:hypothetical protein